jgi:cell division protein FtsW
MKLSKLFKRAHESDRTITTLMALLTVGGLVILASASSNLGETQFHDSYYFLKHQILYGLSLGIVGFLLMSRVHYLKLKKIAFPLLILSILLLIMVFTPFGLHVRNTSRWIRLGPFSFQPAEVLKITYILYLAAWLSNATMRRARSFGSGFVPFLLVSGIIGILLVLQPATSTVFILLAAGLIVYFFSGAPWKYIIGYIGLGVLGLALVITITPYRRTRITSYLTHNADTEGSGYHVNQAQIAIGSGGVTGVGYGKSTTKISFLPTPADDSIFAVAAEELGFVGSSIIIILFATLTIRMFWLAARVKERFGQLLLIGFGTIIALQSIVNIASISGLAPLTGVPLPFISYGGTALAIFMTMIGITSNISANT